MKMEKEIDNYNPRVCDAKYVKDRIIEVTFNNGVKKQIDFTRYITYGVFEPLKDMEYFKKFFADGWTVSWPNGADVAPETLYYDH